jgi:hypothetical protein
MVVPWHNLVLFLFGGHGYSSGQLITFVPKVHDYSLGQLKSLLLKGHEKILGVNHVPKETRA